MSWMRERKKSPWLQHFCAMVRLGQSDALNLQADLRRTQQGVVNQAMMDGFFDASFVIVAELGRKLHRDAETWEFSFLQN